LAAITSRAGRPAQVSVGNIGRLSNDHAIIAIWPALAHTSRPWFQIRLMHL